MIVSSRASGHIWQVDAQQQQHHWVIVPRKFEEKSSESFQDSFRAALLLYDMYIVVIYSFSYILF